MLKIAIVVLTFKRPEGILKLLNYVSQQNLDKTEIELLTIVVDNDEAKSAESVVCQFIKNNSSIKVKYIHEPQHGIPIARNTGIRNIPDDYEFICFIDDDEFPSHNWIESLLTKQKKLDADCIAAPVIPVLPKDTPAWVVKSKVFDGWSFKNEQKIYKAASNNVLISLDFIRKNNLLFNEKMSTTGGSDFHFFKQANNLGMRIYWTTEAPVYEDIPHSRLKFRWLVQRQFRLGNTYAVSARLSKSLLELMLLTLKGFFRVGLGILMLPLSIFSFRLAAISLTHVLRGAGVLMGVFGRSVNEYSKSNIQFDRKTH